MPYTLTKGLLWFLLALLLGVIVGWLLRSIRATRQVRAARHARHDAAEAERLRARIANLEPLIAENARLKAELGGHAAPERVADDVPDDAIDTGTEAAIDARVPADEPDPTPEPEPEPAAEPVVPSGEPVEPIAAFAPAPEPAGDAPVALDDLTAIEGVGPATAELLNRIGIHTWAELGRTEVSLLRTMLSDAGPQFATHQPDTWPEQATLLAAGRWDDFHALVARLGGGTAVE